MLVYAGWPGSKVLDMPMPDMAISICALVFNLVFFVLASSIVYCIILRKRGRFGINRIGIGLQSRTEIFTIYQHTLSLASWNWPNSNSEKSLCSSQVEGFDYRFDFLSEIRRQAEIRASVLSLKTNLLLTIASLIFVYLSAFYQNTISNVMASLIKTWTPIFTMVVNFHMVHEVVEELKRNLLFRVDSLFQKFY